jgi:CAAX protease family protein
VGSARSNLSSEMSSAPQPQVPEAPSGLGAAGDGGEPERPRLWIAPLALVIGLCASVVATVAIYGIGAGFGASTAHEPPAVNLLASLAFDLAFVAAALYLSAVRRRRPRAAEFGYVRIGLWAGVRAFFVAAIAYYAISWAYAALLNLHGTDKLPSGFDVKTSTAAMLATAAFVCVVAPICEEFFFRGFFFGVLARMRVVVAGREAGPWVAAVITGIVFGAAHVGSASSAQYLIPLGFLGFVLCLVRWATGSLYPCMALHSANNSLALGVLLGWNLGEVVALTVAAWGLIAALTGPLARTGGRGPWPVAAAS